MRLIPLHCIGRAALALGLVALLGVPSAVWARAKAGPSSDALAACAARVSFGHAARSTLSVPPDRLKALAKGVNLTDAFSPDVTMARLMQDFKTLYSSGIRHVRIPIDPGPVLNWPGSGDPDALLHRLDETVCQATAAGLAVILDMHPEGRLALNDDAQSDTLDNLAAAWDRLATRYAVFTPDRMVFEAMNEPGLSNSQAWEPMQQTLLAHIRRAAPMHTVLLTASPDSTAGALAGLTPVKDPNVAYVFHFYSPMVFTHQGAWWVSEQLSSIQHLLYPAAASNVYDVQRLATSEAAMPLTNYLAEYAVATAVQAEIGIAAQWAKKNKVPVVVTEFGVFAEAAPPASRLDWLRNVRQALDAQSIGWTVWEYRGGFGIDAGLGLLCNTGGSMRNALGLCGAASTK